MQMLGHVSGCHCPHIYQSSSPWYHEVQHIYNLCHEISAYVTFLGAWQIVVQSAAYAECCGFLNYKKQSRTEQNHFHFFPICSNCLQTAIDHSILICHLLLPIPMYVSCDFPFTIAYMLVSTSFMYSLRRW